MTRCFIALALPEKLTAPLTVLQQMLPLRRRTPSDSFHVTLAFPGELRDAQIEDLHDALLALRAAPVPLRLTAPSLFGGDRPRVIYAGVAPVPELVALHDRVQAALRRAGLPPEARRFVPHVTLSRESPKGPDLVRLESALAGMSDFSAGPETVRDLRLMASYLGHGAPVYEPLEIYPLTA